MSATLGQGPASTPCQSARHFLFCDGSVRLI
ncbi:H-X9-DG-CTERM domain-containing protein [Lacticaseibacillus rhamnosus]